jgi:hypothetical protein
VRAVTSLSHNCFQEFAAANKLGYDQLAHGSLGEMRKNPRRLLSVDANQRQLQALPEKIQLEVLWKYVGVLQDLLRKCQHLEDAVLVVLVLVV